MLNFEFAKRIPVIGGVITEWQHTDQIDAFVKAQVDAFYLQNKSEADIHTDLHQFAKTHDISPEWMYERYSIRMNPRIEELYIVTQ